jgi:dienelactone hydrolase
MTRYPLNALFHARLARLGYLVLDVDYRGSAGYGGPFRTDVQGHLGGKDLNDIHLVVDDLIARGLVDARRVGCYGGSYGGFLTLMALFTAPERWSAGCALRSVTDWRSYHPDYAQPRLGRPSTDPEAYALSSPIDHVDGLQDPLLVLHGLVDTNVFAQDSVRLIEALIDAGKDFDAMLYPSQGHAFEDGAHWLDEYRRIERFLIAHLGPPLILEGGPWAGAAWVDGCYCPFFFHDHGDDDDGAPLGPPVESIDAASGGVLDTGERGGLGGLGDSDRGGGGRGRGSPPAR